MRRKLELHPKEKSFVPKAATGSSALSCPHLPEDTPLQAAFSLNDTCTHTAVHPLELSGSLTSHFPTERAGHGDFLNGKPCCSMGTGVSTDGVYRKGSGGLPVLCVGQTVAAAWHLPPSTLRKVLEGEELGGSGSEP